MVQCNMDRNRYSTFRHPTAQIGVPRRNGHRFAKRLTWVKKAPLSGSLLLSVSSDRSASHLDRGRFAQVGRKISSGARSSGVMLVVSMGHSRRIASGEIYGV